jgi:hypothetical protein
VNCRVVYLSEYRKVKVALEEAMKARLEVEVQLYSFFNLGAQQGFDARIIQFITGRHTE